MKAIEPKMFQLIPHWIFLGRERKSLHDQLYPAFHTMSVEGVEGETRRRIRRERR